MSKNPYASAAGVYGDHAQKHTPDQRELEARVLLKSAAMLQGLQNDWGNVSKEILQETLEYNRQIWMLFYDTALENPEGNRPNDLRSNIINLANFIFKREVDIMSKPEPKKLDAIININRELATGLMQQQKNHKSQAAGTTEDVKKPPENPQSGSSTLA